MGATFSPGIRPSAASAGPCLANTGAKKTVTAWPNMIGSDTFIIVAFRCSDASTPAALAPANAPS